MWGTLTHVGTVSQADLGLLITGLARLVVMVRKRSSITTAAHERGKGTGKLMH